MFKTRVYRVLTLGVGYFQLFNWQQLVYRSPIWT